MEKAKEKRGIRVRGILWRRTEVGPKMDNSDSLYSRDGTKVLERDEFSYLYIVKFGL